MPTVAPAKQPETDHTPDGRSRRRRQLSGQARMERRWAWLLGAPVMLGFVLFTIGPMLASFVIGFTDWVIGGTPQFVGLDNYEEIVRDDLFYASLRATLYYAVLTVPMGLVVAFSVALILNQTVRGRGVFRTIFYLPVLVPAVANAVLWLWIFNPDYGLLNGLLSSLGLPTLDWIYDTDTAVPSLAMMNIWAFGAAAVIFLAGLQGIPREMNEAVDCDGGNSWHKFRHVTVPFMTPIIFFNLVIGAINALQVFTEAYIMTDGGPQNSTLFYVFYIYRTAFTESRLAYASALSWILFMIVVITTGLVFLSGRQWVFYLGDDQR